MILHMLKSFDIKKLLKDHKYLFLFLALNIFSLWKIMIMRTQLAYGDLSPFPESAAQAFEIFFYTWEDIGFGYSRSAGAIFPLIQAVLLTIFRVPVLAQKVFLFTVPMISYFFMDRFLRREIQIKSGLARFLAATFYTFAPVALGEFVGGTVYATITIFSLFPVLFSHSYKVIQKFNFRTIFLHGLFLGIISSIYSQVLVIYAVAMFIPATFDLIRTRFKSFPGWTNFLYVGLIAFLFNPIFFGSSFNLIAKREVEGETVSFADNSATFLSDIAFTYKHSDPLTTFRLGSIASFSFDQLLWWTTIFWVIVIAVLFNTTRLLLNKRTRNYMTVVALANYLFIAMFVFLTKHEITYPIFNAVPVLFLFRNPSKLMYIGTFFFAILFAHFLDDIPKIKYLNFNPKITYAIVIIVMGIYAWPISSGDRGLSYTGRVRYYIPDEYIEAVAKLRELRGDQGQRTLWVPSKHEDTFIKLLWMDPTKLEAQIGVNNFGDPAYERGLVSAIQTALVKDDIKAIKNIAKISQIDYIVKLKDEVYYERQNFSKLNADVLLDDLEVVADTEHYQILKIEDTHDLAYTPEHVMTSNTDLESNFFALAKIDNNIDYALLNPNDITRLNIPNTVSYSFLAPARNSNLMTNVIHKEDLEWREPKKFPDELPEIQPDDLFYDYLQANLENTSEVAEYITKRDNLINPQIERLQRTFATNIGNMNNILEKIPDDKKELSLLSNIQAVFLFYDRAYTMVNDAGFSTPIIDEQFQRMSSVIETYKDIDPCEYTYCYTFSSNVTKEFDIAVYDIHEENIGNDLLINDQTFPLTGKDDNWIEMGPVTLNAGPNEIFTNLSRVQKDFKFDDENNLLIVEREPLIRKYEIEFLYSLADDTTSSLYYDKSFNENYDDDKPVVRAELAKSQSTAFCYEVIDGRCYRRFLVSVQPTGATESIVIELTSDMGMEPGARNHIRDVTVEEVIHPTISARAGGPIFSDRPKIDIRQINPVKYEIDISNISKEFVLVFNKSFNKNWIAETSQGGKLPEAQHFLVNYFANAWQIRPENVGNQESTKITLEFYLQKYFMLSLVSTFLISAVGVFLIFQPKLLPNMVLGPKNETSKKS